MASIASPYIDARGNFVVNADAEVPMTLPMTPGSDIHVSAGLVPQKKLSLLREWRTRARRWRLDRLCASRCPTVRRRACLRSSALPWRRRSKASPTHTSSAEVLAQQPTAGGVVKTGTVISLSVCDGPGVKVPVVVDKTQAQAVQALKAVGLYAIIMSMPPGSGPDDPVTGQFPAGGTIVASGSYVTLNVSTGPIVVPEA
jgi:hypothetical protein